MPNYIKNRIELTGTVGDINAMISKFSTFFDKEPDLACDGEFVFLHKETGEPGWLDKSIGKFKRRNQPDVNDVPDGFEQKFNEVWTRFPDFDKIVPMPKGLEANPHSGIQSWIKICTGQIDLTGNDDQSSIKGVTKSLERMNAVKCLTEGKNLKDFSDEELELFIQGVKNYREYGHISWYEWSIENWGTKWNSSECEKVSDNVYDFQTAWSGVPDLIEKMSKAFPTVKIVYKYSDEDTGHNCGIGEYQNGEVSFKELEGGSNEAYEMAFELRPDRKVDYQLVGDKYKYVDSEEE